jgi:alkanesulfonate monooxygenase SsuD/methylene tetrahydromethanopterin reductase-like flavin-dependent oxidoreductase (luciferase family)
VRFGMQLPVQSQSTFYAEPWEGTAGRRELAAIATACDRAGFDYVAVCDHVAIPAEKAEAMSTVWYDTVATLGWLAGITERVRLLSHVYVPAYRHPLATAKAFATLDELSGGRVVLGVGAGHVEREFEVLGIPFAERGRLTDEMADAVATVRAMRADDGRPASPGRPFTCGGIMRPVFLGDPGPDWELGKATLAGDVDRIRREVDDYEAMGVDVLQVRFHSRSAAEYVEQVERFAQEVMS